MRKRTVALISLSAVASLVACGGRLDFQESYDPAALAVQSPRYFEFQTAPIVVVGVVRAVERIGRPQNARRANGVLIQLNRVAIHVENVLRGNVGGSDADFYFFGFSDENPGYSGPPRMVVSPGERRIFFLTSERGQLRAVADVLDYTVLVVTGFHSEIGPPGGSVDGAISEVLLSLGTGYDSSALIANLPLICPLSDYLTSRPNTVRLLKSLAHTTDNSLAIAACFYLSEEYEGQYGCLTDIVASRELSREVRARAEALQEEKHLKDQELAARLRRYRLDALTDAIAPRQELEMLVDDPDPQIRSLACDLLTRCFADESLCKSATSSQ